VKTMAAGVDRRFYRDADRAILGGVCAGLAANLGLNLRMTRFLACIAFFMAMPIAVVSYLAAVFFIPSVSSGGRIAGEKKSRWRNSCRTDDSLEVGGSEAAAEISRRCETMDERLVRLEKHVTSKRFQLEQELSRL